MKLSRLVNVLLPVSFGLFSSVAGAGTYDYHPDARLYLGGGYDPEKINEGYASGCLGDYTVNAFNEAGPATVHIKYVRSEVDIQRAMGISASASANFLFASGHLTAELANENAFYSDSITFIIFAKQHYGRDVINNPTIRTELLALTPEQLLNRCGPEIVTEQTLGASIFAIFTLSNISENERAAFNASGGAGLNGGVFSAELQTSLRTFFQNTRSTMSVSMKVYSIGGQGITELRNLLPSLGASMADAISAAPTTIRNYIEGMTRERAVPISFTTMRLGRLATGNIPTQASFDNLRLERLYERYLTVHSTLGRLDRILHNGDPSYAHINAEDRSRLLGNSDAYSTAQNQMLEEGRVCFGPAPRAGCRLNSIIRDLPVVQWPEKAVPAPAETPAPTPQPTPVPTPEPRELNDIAFIELFAKLDQQRIVYCGGDSLPVNDALKQRYTDKLNVDFGGNRELMVAQARVTEANISKGKPRADWNQLFIPDPSPMDEREFITKYIGLVGQRLDFAGENPSDIDINQYTKGLKDSFYSDRELMVAGQRLAEARFQKGRPAINWNSLFNR